MPTNPLATPEPRANTRTTPAHTPGPWHIEGYSRGFLEKHHNDLCIFATPRIGFTPGEICRIRLPYHNWERTTANARLIAASPELLQALKRLINTHTGAIWQTEEVQRNAWINAAEVIDQAEGKDPTPLTTTNPGEHHHAKKFK